MSILKILNNKKWKISIQTKLAIYFSLVRSNIDYASILFHHISEFCKKRLQGVQYACLRLILKKPFAYSSSIMHHDLKLITLPDLRLFFQSVLLNIKLGPSREDSFSDSNEKSH
jgi:hypothetical protein